MAASDNSKYYGIAHLLNVLDTYEGDWDYDFQRFLGTAVPKPVTSPSMFAASTQQDPGNYQYTPSNFQGAKTKFSNMSGPTNGVYGNTWGIRVSPEEMRKDDNYTNSILLNDLKDACMVLGLTVYLTDIFRGPDEHYGAKGSLHRSGNALDIALVNGRTANLQNEACVALYNWLAKERGYKSSGKELLLGPPFSSTNNSSFQHNNHLHMGIR